MSNLEEYIYLGKLTQAHGIKGEFKLLLENPEDSILQKDMKIYLKDKNENYHFYEVESLRIGNKAIIKLKDIDTRNQVEELIPRDLYILKSDFERYKSNDEIYLNDLLNFKLVDFESGELLGKILSFYSNGPQDIAVCKLQSGKKMDVPMVDQFFREYDLEKQVIKVSLPRF